MSSRIARRIDEWSTTPAGTGYDGLRSLAEEEFTGVITSGETEAAMLNGRVVGVFGGTLESLSERSLTGHEAPHPALPLLLTMQRQDPDPRARYYTADTPLSEVDQTLAGGFTGFVELSENVLSGDYYIVYYGGQSLSVAFLGESDRLITDEEAFDRAADEVGIYEVFDAEITVYDIPSPADTDREQSKSEEPAAASADEATPSDIGADNSNEDPASEPEQSPSDPEKPQQTVEPEGQRSTAESPEQQATAEPHDADSGDQVTETLDDTAVTQIPALDPDRTKQQTEPTDHTSQQTQEQSVVRANGHAGSQASSQQIESLKDRIAELETKRDELNTAYEQATETIEELEAENERLRDRINDLESELETARETDTTAQEGTRLTPADALSQTALFLRYDSQSRATLADIDTDDKETINENLRIDYHTQFTAAETTIDGQPFEAYLESTIEHRFLTWLVRELGYEIQGTDNEDALADLYAAIPKIDRVQFNEPLTLTEEADQETASFDCVAYDRVGDPLVVAQFNDSRDPATESMVAELSTAATAAATAAPSLSAAFFVTASFFRPEALETATTSTGGGFLSRDARKSHVKISRTQGYHLCLVEAREQTLNLTLPEL